MVWLKEDLWYKFQNKAISRGIDRRDEKAKKDLNMGDMKGKRKNIRKELGSK